MRLALYTGLILAGGYACLTPALAAVLLFQPALMGKPRNLRE